MKKATRVVSILFLIFGALQIAQATEAEAARIDLQNSLTALAKESETTQQKGYGKGLQQKVQAFLKKAVVREGKFDSAEFKNALSVLVNQIDPNQTPGVLSKAIQDVESKFKSFETSEGRGSGAAGDGPPPNTNSNPNGAGTGVGAGTNTDPNKTGSGERETEWDLYDYIMAGAIALIVITSLGLSLFIALKLMSLQRRTDEYFVSVLPKALSGVRVRQDELAKQVDASALVSKDINQRLTEVHTELRLMSRNLQQASLAGNRPANFSPSYSEPSTPENNGPVFPIAADELLRQMQTKSVVVKRDFQNDMLVSDPEGKGELVLLRDSHIADELQPLFLVPRVTQFQMRQEYYNFYAKYYECANPESGLVWIVDPAVVEKVAGGWELREKGRLEVR